MQKSYPIFLATILLLLLFPGTSFFKAHGVLLPMRPNSTGLTTSVLPMILRLLWDKMAKYIDRLMVVIIGHRSALPNNAYIRSIEFLDDSIGYIGTIYDAVGGVGLYSTTNGGVSWTRINNSVTGGNGICGLDHKNQTIIGVGIYSERAGFISQGMAEIAAKQTDYWECCIGWLSDIGWNTFCSAGNSPDGRKALTLKSTDGERHGLK